MTGAERFVLPCAASTCGCGGQCAARSSAAAHRGEGPVGVRAMSSAANRRARKRATCRTSDLGLPRVESDVVEPSEHDSQSGRLSADEQALQTDADRVRDGLAEAVDNVQRGRDLAETLCAACVDLLIVDGASLSVVQDGTVGGSVVGTRRTLVPESILMATAAGILYGLQDASTRAAFVSLRERGVAALAHSPWPYLLLSSAVIGVILSQAPSAPRAWTTRCRRSRSPNRSPVVCLVSSCLATRCPQLNPAWLSSVCVWSR